VALVGVFGTLAEAHVVVDRTALRAWLQRSDLAIVAEFESGPVVWRSPSGDDRQDVYRVRVVETLRGEAPETERFSFVPVSEGLPVYERGDRALLFLKRTGSNPMLRHLAESLPYFGDQGPGDEWQLGGADGPVILEQTRRWVAWMARGEAADSAGLQALLLEELRSGSPRLRADALAEIARLHDRPQIFASGADLAPFAALLGDASIPLAERLSLAHSFEGRPDAGVTAWYQTALSDEAMWTNEERRQLLRTVGGRDEAWAVAWSRAQLASDAPEVRREAVRALAAPQRAEVVALLAGAVADPDPGVAREAIHGLGTVGTLGAREVLEAFAVQGPEPLDHWAAAELRRSDTRLR
jgi:hypothetical protein